MAPILLPQVTDHLRKASDNARLQVHLARMQPAAYYDWQITVLFYASLHCVQAYFVQMGPYAPKNHPPRNTLVSADVSLGIGDEYQALYDLSLMARYAVDTVTPADVAIAVMVHRRIQTRVNMILYKPDTST